MRVLVVGCGSIGKRHITNLLAMEKIESIVVCTKNEGCLEIFGNEKKIEFTEELNDLPMFQDSYPPVSSNNEIDFAIIANETSKHIDTAVFLAERGIHLFIEKPLSHNLKKVDLLRETAERKKIKIYIAYNLRFLGILKYIKDVLSRKGLGSLYFARIEVGQYLPSWRSTRDYRTTYSAASNAKGGGVALDLSHEVDYMRYLFGDPYHWITMKTKVSTLEIDAEDIFEGLYKYDCGFICSVHMDYLQTNTRREIRIEGSEGTLVGDLIGKIISIKNKEKKELLVTDENLFDTAKTYIEELNHFVRVIERKEEPAITLHDGISALKLLEDINV